MGCQKVNSESSEVRLLGAATTNARRQMTVSVDVWTGRSDGAAVNQQRRRRQLMLCSVWCIDDRQQPSESVNIVCRVIDFINTMLQSVVMYNTDNKDVASHVS